MSDGFYITLVSNVRCAEQDNKISKFRTLLPRTLNFSSRNTQHEVALIEISYPISYHNIKKEKRKNHEGTMIFRDPEKEINQSERVPAGMYHHDRDLVRGMIDATPKGFADFRLQFFNRKVRIKLFKGQSLKISQRLADLLGFNKTIFTGPTAPNGPEHKLYTSTRSCQPMLGLNYMFIYSNIVENQIVGDTQSPLLRTIALKPNKRDETMSIQKVQFLNPVYLKTATGYFNSIDIELRNELGELVPFTKGRVVLILHFKPINNNH